MSLPTGYVKLKYIESTGTQYIDTGFKPNQDTRVVFDYAPVSTKNTILFGARTSSGSSDLFLVLHAEDIDSLRDDYQSNKWGSGIKPTGRTVIDKNQNVTTIGDTTHTHPSGTFQSTLNLYLFGGNTGGSIAQNTSVMLYSCQIYDNDTLIRNYAPCRSPDGSVGLYDIQNNVFCGNAGTGDFKAPPQTGDILNFGYIGAAQSVTLPPGQYRLEAWGAQGGYRSSSSKGGMGGYSVGELALDEETLIIVQVGGAGNTGGTAGGYNGGGKRGSYNGGGGATDFRIGTDSLLARVMVAGGGGSDGASGKAGGYGGGETGQSRTDNYGTGGYGGTQTGVSSSSWQTTSRPASTTDKSGAYAGFGFGGNGITRSGGYGGAGGGGWYGGSGAYPDGSGDDDRGGAGGSGFVWMGKNAPSGYLLGAANHLANASTKAGNTAFPSPSGSSETGHAGNGYARITILEIYLTTPDTPANFRQTAKDYFSLSLAWDAVECTGYKLYRDGVLLTDTTATSYTDTTVRSNKRYIYTLTAYNDDGESDPVSVTAETKEGFVVLRPVIHSAVFSKNPADINAQTVLTVCVTDELLSLEPEIWYSGELYSGEV